MTTDHDKRALARERKKRFLERQSQGVTVRPLEVWPDDIEALIGFGYLSAMSADSPDSIDAALREAVSDYLGTRSNAASKIAVETEDDREAILTS
ncbi:hypothetical protein [Hwanghaeella sp.]|uniref:hypothetical protein n=1 Tax=Hwanghaeella sp. TaxID=2605943 RepID=UPI003CCBF99F